MADYNKVILLGRLTRDPELRYITGGVAVCRFGLAMSRTYGQGDDRKEETTFVDVTAWARQGELCEQYLSKGRQVHVDGRLKLDTWEDKGGGGRRSRVSVVAESVLFLGGGESRPQASPETPPSPKATPAPTETPPPPPKTKERDARCAFNELDEDFSGGSVQF